MTVIHAALFVPLRQNIPIQNGAANITGISQAFLSCPKTS